MNRLLLIAALSSAAIIGLALRLSGEPQENFYAGSLECRNCHTAIYDRWKITPHARALYEKKEAANFPELPALLEKYPGVARGTFEVAFAIGYHWSRRYVLENGRVAPFLYSVLDRRPADHFDRNYKRTDFFSECAGCHATGLTYGRAQMPDDSHATESAPNKYDGKDNGRAQMPDDSHAAESAPNKYGEVTGFREAGVGCEACHGPGGRHSLTSLPGDIVNPPKLGTDEAEIVCMSCHTSGSDASGKFRFPAGYRPGDDLFSFFTALEPKPGQIKAGGKEFRFAGDNSPEDRKRQYAYWKSVFMSKNGLSCGDCLDFRKADASPAGGDIRKKINEAAPEFYTVNGFCFTCHGSLAPFDTSAVAVLHEGYSFDPAGDRKTPAAGSPKEASCLECHTSASVHGHEFIPDLKTQ